MPIDEAQALSKAIDVRVTDMIEAAIAEYPEGLRPNRRDVIAAKGGLAAMRLDAYLDLAFNPATVELTVLVDHRTLTGEESSAGDSSPEDNSVCETGGQRIDPEVARRLGRDAALVALIEDHHGNPVAVGDKTRAVSRKLRRALEQRDNGMCQFHGCGATSQLHAHHIIYWTNGGPTTLDNLILLCHFHHHQVHEGGWNIRTTDDGGHDFINPHGQLAGVDVFRGRLQPLHTPPGTHAMANNLAERVDDLSWITTMIIHNRTMNEQRRAA